MGGKKRDNKEVVREGDQGENVAQSSRRVKDKRLKSRACGILDPACCQCYWAVKGLIPTPVNQG